MTCIVNGCQGRIAGVLLYKCYNFGGDTSLDGVGIINNLGKIKRNSLQVDCCSLSLHS